MTFTSPVATIRGACPHDCPDTCSWVVTVEDGVATKLVGNPDHPYTHGGLCAKVNHYLDRVYSPDRILYPLRRTGPKGSRQFERVTWDAALTDIAQRLQQIITEDGPTAILPYSYMGTQGFVQGPSLESRFFSHIGASRLVRAICGWTSGAGQDATMGTTAGMLPEDLAHSKFIILWGTNTIVTNLHLWPYIRKAKEKGATIVVVDPVRSRTADAADWHIRPFPGTDGALALGMMNVIVAENLHDADYVANHTVGFADLQQRLSDYPPERVAEITGVPVEEIIRFARAYATTKPAAIRRLIGLGHHQHGGMIHRNMACLPALVGAWKEVGGGLVGTTAVYFGQAVNWNAAGMPELEDRSIRQFNMVQIGKILTDPTLQPAIRAFICCNSNPAAIAPNQSLVLQGLHRDDLFSVVHEQFMTDTAAAADYVLPATTEVEHLDLLWSWGHTYLTLNLPAIAPLGEAVSNTEFFRRLSGAMGLTEPWLFESDEQIIRNILASNTPSLHGITWESLCATGWAKLALPDPYLPFAAGNFPTPSGKCEFYSERLAADGFDPLPAYTAASESPTGGNGKQTRYPLAIMTPKSALHFLNSSYGGVAWHRNVEKAPLLDLHPRDAEPRGITDGSSVRIFNDRAELTMTARVSDRVIPGLVIMPSGWWASHSEGGLSANALTADGLADMGGGGDFHDTLVQVALAANG